MRMPREIVNVHITKVTRNHLKIDWQIGAVALVRPMRHIRHADSYQIVIF
jgi:hypothetical protein